MAHLKDKLANGQFVVTMEVDPPHGASPWGVYEDVKQVVSILDAVNIADCPTAKLRMSPIALAALLQKHNHIETIFHLTARDRNVMGLQAELLGAWALDVRNILCLTGDAPALGDHPDSVGVYEVDSVGLARIASHCLNQGVDYMQQPLHDCTDFCVGAVANPGVSNLEAEYRRLKDKAEAGVCFFQTQPVYNLAQVERFMDKMHDIDASFIFGIMPILSEKQAAYMNTHVPGVHVPDEIVTLLRGQGQTGVTDYLRGFIRDLRGLAAGVHIFPMGKYERAKALLEETTVKNNDSSI